MDVFFNFSILSFLLLSFFFFFFLGLVVIIYEFALSIHGMMTIHVYRIFFFFFFYGEGEWRKKYRNVHLTGWLLSRTLDIPQVSLYLL